LTHDDSHWFQRPIPLAAARARLFCFPYAGAGAAAYRGWGAGLAPAVEVLAVRLPGRERRFLEDPFDDLAACVDAFVEVLQRHSDRPFAFFGHSMGALVAYETTRELIRRQQALPVHLFASGRVAPHLVDPDGEVHLLSDAGLVTELRERGQTPEEVLENPELLELLLPAVRADFALAERYRHAAGAPLPVPITAFGGTEDPDVPPAAVEAWGEHTALGFEHIIHPGGHFFLDAHTAAIERRILKDLAAHLTTSRGTT
jgi:surfactin synthase thioesterase subunit